MFLQYVFCRIFWFLRQHSDLIPIHLYYQTEWDNPLKILKFLPFLLSQKNEATLRTISFPKLSGSMRAPAINFTSEPNTLLPVNSFSSSLQAPFIDHYLSEFSYMINRSQNKETVFHNLITRRIKAEKIFA